MLTINLLSGTPEGAAGSPLEQWYRLPLVWAIVGGLAGLLVLLWIPVSLQTGQLRRMQTKIAQLAPRKAAVDALRQYTQQLRDQEDSFRQLTAGGRRWSRRLNTLSNLLPESVWFTELSLEAGQGFMLQGAALAMGGAETGSIPRLVQELHADADFAAAVPELKIESMKSTLDGPIELVQFTLQGATVQGPAAGDVKAGAPTGAGGR